MDAFGLLPGYVVELNELFGFSVWVAWICIELLNW